MKISNEVLCPKCEATIRDFEPVPHTSDSPNEVISCDGCSEPLIVIPGTPELSYTPFHLGCGCVLTQGYKADITVDMRTGAYQPNKEDEFPAELELTSIKGNNQVLIEVISLGMEYTEPPWITKEREKVDREWKNYQRKLEQERKRREREEAHARHVQLPDWKVEIDFISKRMDGSSIVSKPWYCAYCVGEKHE